MIWLCLALITAFTSATADALTKKYLAGLNAYEMGAIRLTYTLPWLVPIMFFVPFPRIDKTFFFAVSFALPLELLAFVCYMKAIKISPLSLTLPFLAFTPVFMILTGRIILKETLTMPGVIGVMLIVAGSYFLNIQKISGGILGPFKAIIKEPGSLLMLLVAFLYSITSTMGKLGILHSSPAFFGIFYFCLLSLLMLFMMPFAPGMKYVRLISRPYPSIIIGMVYAAMVMSHMYAISMVNAAYMIAIKRMSLVFGVLYGACLFEKGYFAERITGSIVMICGVFVIVCFG